jgi:Gas vesicle protein
LESSSSDRSEALVPSSSASPPPASQGGDNLADVLERVLDKGVVIAGDIQVNLLDIELLTIKLRLIVASVDTARRIGLNWWETDPWLGGESSQDDSRSLRERVKRLERELESGDADEGRALSSGDLEDENRALREQVEQLERKLEGEE